MKQANWTMNSSKVRTWAETQPESDKLQTIMLSLSLGDNAESDELRSTYWTAIRSIGSTMDNFPKARRGRESALSENQEIVLANVAVKVVAAFAAIPTEYHSLLLQVIVPHGRTGGVYSDWNTLCTSFEKQAINYIMQSIKDKRVAMTDEGEFDLDKSGMLQITPRPTKADSSEVDEEE